MEDSLLTLVDKIKDMRIGQIFMYGGYKYMIMPYGSFDCQQCGMFNVHKGCMPWATSCVGNNRKDGIDVYFQQEAEK